MFNKFWSSIFLENQTSDILANLCPSFRRIKKKTVKMTTVGHPVPNTLKEVTFDYLDDRTFKLGRMPTIKISHVTTAL